MQPKRQADRITLRQCSCVRSPRTRNSLILLLLIPALGAQPSVLSLRVVGDADPLTVEVSDEAARPVAGATVTFRVGDGGPTAEARTDPQGRASLPPIADLPPGPREIRIFAAKGDARAGIVALRSTGLQPVSVAQTEAPHVLLTPTTLAGRSEIKTSHRWVYIVLCVAAGVGGGLAWRMSQSHGAIPAAVAPPTGPDTTRLTIGIPAITIGSGRP
jgi:hypothetical protein